MDSRVGESVRESLQQAIKDTKAAEDRVSRSGSAAGEVLRLQNALKVKEKELDDVRKEVTALKSTLNTKDRALSQTEQDLRVLKERNTATEGELANMAKELAALKVDKRKTEVHLSTLTRRGDKEPSLAALGIGNGISEGGGAFGTVPSSEHVAALHAEIRSARMDGDKASEGVRALENVLRGKDRHIAALQRKADEAELYRVKSNDLENKVLELNHTLDDMRAAARAAAETLRNRDAENSRLTTDLNKARATLDAAQDAAARSSAALKASELRCGALEQEVGTLVTQLARTSVVAQRVAASEVKAGCKDEGVVHVTRHLEEIRFLGGEIVRLQERVSGLEKELAVADELKERYRVMLGVSPQDSPASPTPIVRPSGSRSSSAYRRPTSVSRPRSALRASAPTIPAVNTTAADNDTTAASPTAATPIGDDGSSAPAPGDATSPAAAAPGGTSPVVRSTGGRRVSKTLPWHSPAKAAGVVSGTAVGGAGVLARSGTKAGPSVRAVTGPGMRARSAGSAASAAFKGPVGAVKKAVGVRTPSAVETAAVEEPSPARAGSVGGGVLASHPVFADSETGVTAEGAGSECQETAAAVSDEAPAEQATQTA